MNVFAWLYYSFSQPTFGPDRYRATCKSCGAQVKRTRREVSTGVAMLLIGAGAGIAASVPLPWPYRLFAVLGGMVAGVFAHYPLADYQLADPGKRPELPAAKASEPD